MLVAMHVAIALVTYNLLVHVAPVGAAFESAPLPATAARAEPSR